MTRIRFIVKDSLLLTYINKFIGVAAKIRFAEVVLSLTLVGCAVTVLPNGEPSGMQSNYNELRMNLNVTPISSGLAFSYMPISNCSYRQTITAVGMPTKTEIANVSVKSVPKNPSKLLVVNTGEDGKVSTFLIDRLSGKLLDFNEFDALSGQRFTPETYSKIANADLANIPTDRNPHLVNDFSLFMPEFLGNQWNLGDTVSYVNDEDGNLWAQYIYRGVTNYDGQQWQVFDLMRSMPNLVQYGPVMIGFMIFDPSIMMPVLSILDAGTKNEVERLGCTQ